MRLITVLFSAISLLFSSVVLSAPFKMGGFTETVFIVSDLKAASTFYQQVAGWEVRHEGVPSAELKALWGLPQAAKAQQVLLANKGENKGFVRLIKLDGVEQKAQRAHSQAWDIGGIYDVNVRVVDMDKKQQEMEQAGWFSDTQPLQFTFGPFEVKEWIVKGPDGIAFALIQRLKPTLEGWPNLKEFSRVFNSTQVVKDIEVSRNFYEDVLGFQPYLEYRGASKGSGENVLGLPFNVAKTVERSVYILHPDKKNEGSVELLQFHGAEGQDLSKLSGPPNLGIATLRFPVDDLETLKKTLKSHNIAIEKQVRMSLAPYGDVDIIALKTPDNTWIEIYQIVAK